MYIHPNPSRSGVLVSERSDAIPLFIFAPTAGTWKHVVYCTVPLTLLMCKNTQTVVDRDVEKNKRQFLRYHLTCGVVRLPMPSSERM